MDVAPSANSAINSTPPPTITPLTSSSSTVLVLGLTSKTRSLMDLRSLADWTLRQRLLAVPGVSKVAVFGSDIRSLQIQIRPDALLVGDRIGGLIQRIPMVNGQHDLAALGPLIQMIKGKFPETTAATVLAQPDTPYELLVQVMDAVREFRPPTVKGQPVAGAPPAMLLFPDISIGDAPVAVAQKK